MKKSSITALQGVEWVEELKRVMASRKLTAYRLSKMSGVHQTTIGLWLRGKEKHPRGIYRREIERALDNGRVV